MNAPGFEYRCQLFLVVVLLRYKYTEAYLPSFSAIAGNFIAYWHEVTMARFNYCRCDVSCFISMNICILVLMLPRRWEQFFSKLFRLLTTRLRGVMTQNTTQRSKYLLISFVAMLQIPLIRMCIMFYYVVRIVNRV